jgi:hypothetical protein
MNDSQKYANEIPEQSKRGRVPEVSDPEACAEFQKHLPELMGSDAPNIGDDPHVKSCANCAALVRDLESIAQAARELLPVYDPSPDLWSQISTAMQMEPPMAEPKPNGG